jgi:hypothetical protein
LTAATFAQEKIFQDELSFARWKRTIANPARYALVNSFRPNFSFDYLIKRVAIWAMN